MSMRMVRLASAYRNGSITKSLLKETCKINDWNLSIKDDGDILISKMGDD